MSVHRLKRPMRLRWWPRIVVGLGALVWIGFLLYPTASGDSVSVMVAKRNIFAGDHLVPGDFESVTIAPASLAKPYIAADGLPAGAVARREVLAGELVAKTAVGLAAGSLVPLNLQLMQAPASKVVVGATVDIWATAVHLGQAEGQPEAIALGVRVSHLQTTTSMGQERTVAEVMVVPEFVAPLLLAQADGSMLTLILNPTAADGH